MDHIQQQRRERLALLLSGGGRRCRRLVAEVAADGGSVLEPLSRLPAGAALVRAAGDLLGEQVPRLLERVKRAQWSWLTPGDDTFPRLLVHSSDPPLGLFVRGSLPATQSVAIVGSRRATAYGLRVARLLGEELGRAGVPVVSGMARGVDAEAHQGVLDAGGSTVAVWGTGPDRIYPPEHGGLAEKIADHGALITEYPPGTPPRRHHFPERNRILGGMAAVVVVVEAAARSGALVTARLALDEGREVMAVPGNILSPLSAGPNALIRMGARPLLTLRDVFEALGMPDPPKPSEAETTEPSVVLGILDADGALAVDELAQRSGLAVPELLSDLLEMELDGVVVRLDDGRYRRR